MFRKNKKKNKDAAPTENKKDSIPSVLSRHMHILGNIVHEGGHVDLDGTLDGNVRCTGFTVRANGVVTGEIEADTVHVYGRVNGLIRARYVSLFAGCHIEGIVMHEQLSIQDGAYIDGKCKRTDKAPTHALLQNDDEIHEKPVKMLENIRLIS